MKEDYGFHKRLIAEAYDYVRWTNTKGDIEAVLRERFDGDVELTDLELDDAIQIAFDIQDNSIYWLDFAEEAVREVLNKRPLKEATKPLCQYDKTLAEYGLKPHDEFMVANVLGFTDTLYVFNETGRLCYYNFAGETFQPSGHDLADFLIRVYPRDIVRTSLTDFIRSKEKPKSPFNDTLKTIGLETNQFFRINDDEFGGDDFYIDSFGDVYIINGDPSIPDGRDPDMDEQHEYLTLGRILTQYHDKIVPRDVKETGYA